MPLNSHFVSRFLTNPWEFGQRRLWYYDFETDRFDHGSSRSLFAMVGLNSSEVEARLNRLIETPLSRERAKLLGPAEHAAGVDIPWPLYRALVLLLLLQPLRVSDSTNTESTLEEVLAQPDEYADGLAQAMATRYRLQRITVGRQSPLLYPSAGYFPLLGHRVDGTCALAWAIPLSPWHVIVAEPTGVEWALGPNLWSLNGAGFVSNYSVGNASKKVVVHPHAKEGLNEAELRSAIQGMRRGVLQALSLCAESARILRQIDEMYPT